MKTEEMIALALAGIALWMILKSGKAVSATANFVDEIVNPSKPGDDAYGWRYFANGTVIDPAGAYWSDGRMVWAPGLNQAW